MSTVPSSNSFLAYPLASAVRHHFLRRAWATESMIPWTYIDSKKPSRNFWKNVNWLGFIRAVYESELGKHLREGTERQASVIRGLTAFLPQTPDPLENTDPS